MATARKKNILTGFVTVVFITGGLPTLLFLILWHSRGFCAAWDTFYDFVGNIIEEWTIANSAEALVKLLESCENKFSHIRWIKDCGIDSSAGNHPEAERDAMYRIAGDALAEIQQFKQEHS